MKKLIGAFLLAVAAYALGIATVRSGLLQSARRAVAPAPWAPSAHYTQRATMFAALPTDRPEVVMLGDSLVSGGEWGELVPGAVNRGIGGDTIAGVAARLDAVLAAKPRRVVLVIGTNDLKNGMAVAAVERGITDLLSRIRAAGSEPVTCGVLHVGANHRERSNAEIAAVNAGLRAWCAANRVRFVDANAVLAPSGVLLPEFTNDGVHLLGPGYAAWARVLCGG